MWGKKIKAERIGEEEDSACGNMHGDVLHKTRRQPAK